MAKAVLAAEAIAPTRPHAGVESAKANFMVGPFASMLDRARDAIARSRPLVTLFADNIGACGDRAY